MERPSAQADVQQLFERFYDFLDSPDLNRVRGSLRETTDALSTLCMAQSDPGESINWQGILLSPTLATIAAYLHQRYGRIVKRETIHDLLYSENDDPPDIKIINTFMCQLRGALRLANSPWGIINKFGIGYGMVDAAKAPQTVGGYRRRWPPRNVDWRGLVLTGRQHSIIELFENASGYVTVEQVRDALFPGSHRDSVASTIGALKNRLARSGIKLENRWGEGYRLAA